MMTVRRKKGSAAHRLLVRGVVLWVHPARAQEELQQGASGVGQREVGLRPRQRRQLGVEVADGGRQEGLQRRFQAGDHALQTTVAARER
jgi:hypothetical protein